MIKNILLLIALISLQTQAKTPRDYSQEILLMSAQELLVFNKKINHSLAPFISTWSNEYTFIKRAFMIDLDLYYISLIDTEKLKAAGFNMDEQLRVMKEDTINFICSDKMIRGILIAGGKVIYKFSKLNYSQLPDYVISFDDCKYQTNI